MPGAVSTVPASRSERSRRIARVLWIILGLNWTVALLKLVIGHLTHSLTIFADGLHSFSDGASNIVGLIAISIASQPADANHPYGHQKYETLASSIISFLLFFVSFRIFAEAFAGLVRSQAPTLTLESFAVMAFTLVVNVFVVAYERREARKLSSELLSNDSWHTMTDIFVTVGVFAAMGGVALGLPWLDAAFAFGIGGVIFVTAALILKKSSDVLCDKAVLDPARVEEIVRRVEGVRDCHEVRTRGRYDDVYVDMHVLVDSDMTVQASHHLANVIERDIRRELSGIRDVVVHIEPVSHGHEELET